MTDGQAAGGRSNDAKRSIHYLLDAAMEYGNDGGLVDLLDRVAALHQYKPYNAMLVLLQRPAATCGLPAHRWEERYGRIIRPGEQPLVMLQAGRVLEMSAGFAPRRLKQSRRASPARG